MHIILVGGFLGAGKTTLLRETAYRLTRRGHAVGLVTNDQAPELVDTVLLKHTGKAVREVAGSCFCCDFNGFLRAVESLESGGATHVVAEPVGSCTDLSATILQPLKDRFAKHRVAPLSVLVAPERVRGVLMSNNPALHADAAYILRLQLEEADSIVLTKSDTLEGAEVEELGAYLRAEFPHARVAAISSVTGAGLDAWLDEVLSSERAGTRVVDVDYDRYAHGEAVLGWLNASAGLRWIGGLEAEWESFVRDLFAHLLNSLRSQAKEIGHLKLLLTTGGGRTTANLTGLQEPLHVKAEGNLTALNATMTLNARVETSPHILEGLVREALAKAAYARVSPTIRAMHALSPGRPVPTYRYAAVIG